MTTDPTEAKAPAAASAGLTDEMLERFWQRAPRYDSENRFFDEDLEELKGCGYLNAAVPVELGGGGLDLAQTCRQQRRLAYFAAPTALAVNMHLYWTGVAADLWRAGDRSLEWLLKAAAGGEIFGAGHAESGNDLPVLRSSCRAVQVDGGYRFTGRKSFGSLGSAWTYLGLHGCDAEDPTAPKIVHAFLPRGAEGVRVIETWDAMGMRATRSDDTDLDGVFVPDRLIARVVPAGAAGFDPFVAAIFAWALLNFGNIYYGLARRVFDQVLPPLAERRSVALDGPMARHPEIQHAVAEMALALEPVEPLLERVAVDWSSGVDHGPRWLAKLVSAKHCAVEASWQAVDRALDIAGGFGVFRRAGLERLFRDARLGRMHPANRFLTHEIVAKTELGLDFDGTPRWG